MEKLEPLVARAKAGDLDAFTLLVDRFQDMAYGCAYAVLGDFHAAQDASLEAFVAAYQELGKLREPAAFSGWLRRIVMTQCNRMTRRKRLRTVSLERAADVASPEPGPAQAAQAREMKDAVLEAVKSLPPPERMVTTLFYINGYSQSEVAEFLELPVTTVNDRLHASRRRLKKRMVAMVDETLKSHRPGPEQGRRIVDELMARKTRFDNQDWAQLAAEAPKWADRYHERRMEDVRANAALYGIEPDETLQRMLPERRMSESFRDDFKDFHRRWGIPERTRVLLLREFCREVSALPVAVCRWEAEGLPVIRFFPSTAYDKELCAEWVRERGLRPGESMTPEEAREPLLATFCALAAGDVTLDEARNVLKGFFSSAVFFSAVRSESCPDNMGLPGLDPLWEEEWLARQPEERAANARQYGLEAPADTFFGAPPEINRERVFEIRDFCRRLGLSPVDVIRWTHEGMSCLRCSPFVRWDTEHVAEWLSGRGHLPSKAHTPKELDDLDEFVLSAVAEGGATPEEAREVYTVWLGHM